MKRRLLAGVVWTSLVASSAGCILPQSSGGVAAGGAGALGGGGDDGGAPDELDGGSDDGSDDGSVAGSADGADDGPGDAGAGDDGDRGVSDGGRVVDDGGAADGSGADDAGAAMHCSALPFGCVCSPTEPSQVRACNTTSVIQVRGQQSVCCRNPYNCICVAYECVRDSGASCSCQLAATVAGTRVDDCGSVTTNPAIKCCRSYGQCVCSTLDCLPIETQVSSCSVKDLLGCDVGNTSVPDCEPAGAAGQTSG